MAHFSQYHSRYIDLSLGLPKTQRSQTFYLLGTMVFTSHANYSVFLLPIANWSLEEVNTAVL